MKAQTPALTTRLFRRLIPSAAPLYATAIVSCFYAIRATGQQPAPAAGQDNPSTQNDVVVLSPFNVSEEQVGRYQATQAASGGRIAVSLLDAPQGISVVTRDLIDDTSGWRVLNSLQYATGVVEGTIPNGQDRLTIRGFQVDGQTVDGFESYSQADIDPVFIERIEVIKGPNAVLAPFGVPGGTVNIVTRSPDFSHDFGSATFEDGRFAALRAEIDENMVFGKNNDFAFRVVGSFENADGYAGDWRKLFNIMPMLTFRSKSGVQLTVKLIYMDSYVQNYLGLPIDPSSGSTNTATLLHGVNPYLDTYDSDYREERRPELLTLLTVPLTDKLAMRLAARFTEFQNAALQNVPSTSTEGGATDPLTGLYTPGIVYGPKPTFTPSPAPPEPSTIPRGGTIAYNDFTYANVQNDYTYIFKFRNVLTSTTLAGFALDMTGNRDLAIVTSKAPVNYQDFVPSPNYTRGATSNNFSNLNYDQQVYINESLGLFNDRVHFNGSYSANTYSCGTYNYINSTQYNVSIHAGLRSAGVVVDPIPGTSVYYSYTENATPSGWPDSQNTAQEILALGDKPFQEGAQNEYGIRSNFNGNRLYATACYFDIIENNYGIQNPLNLSVPPPVPLLGELFSDRRAKGWEFELHANITQQLSLVGNASTFKNRDPNNVPFRGTAEQEWAIMANYQFAQHSVLAGLSAFVGVDYLGKRPGDAVSGLTAASTPANPIPVEPTFWLPARTLVNAGSTYKISAHWRVQVNIDNLLNTKYLESSLGRFDVLPGDPINIEGRISYMW